MGRFPFLEVDARAKQVRVECESLAVENPLEFFLCLAGTVEHESVLRSKVRPSHLHAALLMLGLEPGEPVRFSESAKKWLPPHGPPLQISAQFERDGKQVTLPAYRLMRDVKNKREMPPMTWIFAGSRMMEGDVYAADRTGYLISVVNFDFTVIDIPQLASNANETLQWETNLDVMPPKGTKVTLIIEPAGKVQAPADPAAAAGPIDVTLVTIEADGTIHLGDAKYASHMLPTVVRRLPRDRRVRVAVENAIEQNDVARDMINQLSRGGFDFQVVPQAKSGGTPPRAATSPAADSANLTRVRADDAQIQKLREKWQKAVAPHDASLRQAATTHYEVITQLRREQQRLIDEADKIQRLIDELEKQYQDMTTPRAE
ncbi:MAG: hypothetical protein QOF78_3042 [Phycisphaerales bacterium]|nr:hypothetical protein [Phycisphaerales bacterium]